MSNKGNPQHWINVFTPQTWQQFQAAGSSISGFPHRMRKSVAKMKTGDRLLCYVAGISRWIALLEVKGAHFSDSHTDIWGEGSYPERIPVKPLMVLTFDTAVPAVELKEAMPMFASLKNPAQWSIYFRRSPAEIGKVDAEIVLTALRDAEQNPISRPVPPSKLKLTLISPKAEDDEEPVPALVAGADPATSPELAAQGMGPITQKSSGSCSNLEARWGCTFGHRNPIEERSGTAIVPARLRECWTNFHSSSAHRR